MTFFFSNSGTVIYGHFCPRVIQSNWERLINVWSKESFRSDTHDVESWCWISIDSIVSQRYVPIGLLFKITITSQKWCDTKKNDVKIHEELLNKPTSWKIYTVKTWNYLKNYMLTYFMKIYQNFRYIFGDVFPYLSFCVKLSNIQ